MFRSSLYEWDYTPVGVILTGLTPALLEVVRIGQLFYPGACYISRLMLTYSALKNTPGEFFNITGVPVEDFDKFLPQFIDAYGELHPPEKTIEGQASQRQPSSDVRDALACIEDKLLFIWLHQKAQTTRAMLGLQFGLSQSQVNDWIDRLLPVFQLTLHKLTIANLQPNCIQFLQLLNAYQVEYLLIGGRAVAFHGYRRPILDLDIFIATHLPNAQKMMLVLQAFGQRVAPQAVEFFQMKERVIRLGQPPFTVERFAPDARFIQLGTLPIQLEIITSISAVTFDECYAGRVAGVIDDVPVQVIGLVHLMVNKQASIRPKDADDFAHLSESELWRRR